MGLLTVDLALAEGGSLKDKRRVIRGLLDSVRHRFNVSAAEAGHLDSLRRATLAFAAVSNDRAYCNGLLDRVLSAVESEPRVSVVETALELL